MSTEDFDKLSEAEKGFYAMAGDGYQLQVEGATDKSKVDDFRTKNIELMNTAKQFENVDMEKYNAVMEKERQLQNQELIDKKDFDTLLANHTKNSDAAWATKYDALNEQFNALTATNAGTISKYEIEGAANAAFSEHKINPEAFASVMSQVKGMFSIDNGQVVAMNGDGIMAGADGNLTVSEFVAGQPEIFKISSNGGNGQGNSNATPQTQSRSTHQKLTNGLSKLMG